MVKIQIKQRYKQHDDLKIIYHEPMDWITIILSSHFTIRALGVSDSFVYLYMMRDVHSCVCKVYHA